MDDHKITSDRGSTFTINGMIVAYNDNTKEAYFYVEVQRVEKKQIEEHMIRMGAGSVDVTPVSLLEWEADSRRAVQSVIEYGERNGFVAVQYGILAANTRGDGGASTEGASGTEIGGNVEEEHVPKTDKSDEEKHKRKRTASPVGNMISLDVMIDKMTTVVSSAVSSAVASAINSTGTDRSKEREDTRSSLQAELQRQKHSDSLLQELRVEMRQKDDTHAAAMGGLRGELYAKYEEQRLKALDEAAAARGKLEEEKSKLEKNVQDLVQSKVIYYYSLCMDVL
jgi:hypothetical protein